MGRSPFPVKSEWDQWLATHDDKDAVSLKIQRLKALNELGAEVVILNADVSDEEQIRQAVDVGRDYFGGINGVIHTAGLTGEKALLAIEEAGRDEIRSHFRAKAYGLLVLEKCLRGRQIDFCLLMSSLSSILGGLGFAAYSAANLFMDGFAHKQSQSQPLPWISVNWDGWRFAEREQSATIGATVADLAMTPGEGVEALQRILSSASMPQVLVSTGDLQTRIDQWVKLASLREAVDAAQSHSPSLHSRPALHNDYLAPRNATEKTIADVWQEMLGIEQVGIHDDFFELGGHSLLAD